MSGASDYRPIELGMRIMEIVRAHAASTPDFMMSDLSERLTERFGISRATGYRHIRTALDVLCIPYDEGKRRNRFAEKVAEGIDRAKAYGYPNGKGGREITPESRWSKA